MRCGPAIGASLSSDDADDDADAVGTTISARSRLPAPQAPSSPARAVGKTEAAAHIDEERRAGVRPAEIAARIGRGCAGSGRSRVDPSPTATRRIGGQRKAVGDHESSSLPTMHERPRLHRLAPIIGDPRRFSALRTSLEDLRAGAADSA